MKSFVAFLTVLMISMACQNHNHANHQHHEMKSDANASNDKEVNLDCRNCGMPSQDYPKWNVKASSKGTTIWFCSPKCTFNALLHPQKAIKLDKIEMSDFYDLKRFDAQKAFFVIKSDVLGPMGHDLVPLRDKTAAEDFLKEHQGKKILSFEQIDQLVLKELMQN